MALKDYEHHNEDARWMWWQEEGKYEHEPEEYGDANEREEEDWDEDNE